MANIGFLWHRSNVSVLLALWENFYDIDCILDVWLWINIAIFAILVWYLGTRFWDAFDTLYLGIWEILHQFGIYLDIAEP